MMMNSNASAAGATPKGKQAARGDKQVREENRSTVLFYFYVLSVANGLYLALQVLFFWSSFTARYMCLFGFTAALSWFAYAYMKRMAQPLRDIDGVEVSAGSDINMPGHVSDYLKDLMLWTTIVHTLTLISNYFWLLMLVVPAYMLYKLWVNILGPWFFAPAPEDPATADGGKDKKVKEKRKFIRAH